MALDFYGEGFVSVALHFYGEGFVIVALDFYGEGFVIVALNPPPKSIHKSHHSDRCICMNE